ncbi:aminotransferase class I/II-fold pyridoxal phosphate-dependent enzyme [Mycolicibacterium mageritense]|uniref:Aspartate/prephenate aminotransferase n=1 Tax=Mycolicibacterium mageritense TaxID=53462 RepID=A0AAI8TPQ9_MYCME|nr:aminotransferase class I/II-fold pyridoxal phosphate-dependent enzyme [Mycolicibacterium mageritense]BDY26700.1 Aspartate/prephenate aminotransferase [Mycolicibacterium mageritense]
MTTSTPAALYRGVPAAIQRMAMPELEPEIGTSLWSAERELSRTPLAPGYFLDATYADTHRFPPPEWTLSTFAESAGGAGMTYTPYRGDAGVREAVAANVQAVLGLPAATSDEVILTPGTQGALFITLAAIIEPGDIVILPDPDYLSTERTLRYFGAKVVRVPVVFADEGRPVLDPDQLRAAAKLNPKLMVFSHPNNPTGMIYDDSTLALIAELAQTYDFRVLADQLYCRLIYDNETFTHISGLDGMKERTITLLGPSKTESLSGFRIGVAVASSELIEVMEEVQSCSALRAPAYAQHLLARWLADDQDFVASRIVEYQALRDTTVKRINTSSVMTVRPCYGSAYVFPEITVDATEQQVAIALKRDAGIVVNPGYQSGLRGRGHIRLCFAQDEAVWDNALDKILDVVGGFQK